MTDDNGIPCTFKEDCPNEQRTLGLNGHYHKIFKASVFYLFNEFFPNTTKLQKFLAYFEKEMDGINDEALAKEVELMHTIFDSSYPPDTFHEHQESEDSCFRHATNMYFQRKYLDQDFLNQYSQFIKVLPKTQFPKHFNLWSVPPKAAHKDIDELKLAGCKKAFYGDQEVPAASQLQENRSDPAVNEDLNGYYEIYRDTPALEFLDTFAKSEFKDLTPAHVSIAILVFIQFNWITTYSLL